MNNNDHNPQSSLIRVPFVFFEDHRSRDLDTPTVVKETKQGLWIAADDPAIPELFCDAEYYADPYGPDMDIGFRSSARATAKALRAIPNIKALIAAYSGDGQRRDR